MEAPAALLALRVSGDWDGLTLYTSRSHKLVAFPRSPPTQPPSAAQLAQRQRFAAAINNWTLTTQQQRINYDLATRRLSLSLTGLNLWIILSFRQSSRLLATLSAQASLTLNMPPAV